VMMTAFLLSSSSFMFGLYIFKKYEKRLIYRL
jgi:hypothetical protein